jgi:hypothetical protein
MTAATLKRAIFALSTSACLTLLGRAYYQAGRYEEALENLRGAARRLPSFRATYVSLAGYCRPTQT